MSNGVGAPTGYFINGGAATGMATATAHLG